MKTENNIQTQCVNSGWPRLYSPSFLYTDNEFETVNLLYSKSTDMQGNSKISTIIKIVNQINLESFRNIQTENIRIKLPKIMQVNWAKTRFAQN